MFQESYFTLRYDEVKKQFPDTFGFDIGLTNWLNNGVHTRLKGFDYFKPMATTYNPLVIQRYEQREIGAETPNRWMWFLDRKLSSLCEKYGDALSSYPNFVLSSLESKRKSHTDNDGERDDTVTRDEDTTTTDDTTNTRTDNLKHTSKENTDDTHQEYPHSNNSTIDRTHTTSGNFSHGDGELSDTGNVTNDIDGEVKVDSWVQTTTHDDYEDHSDTDDTYETINDTVLRWPELVQKRTPLIDMYLNDFNDLFISVVGAQLMPRADLLYWGLTRDIFRY